MRPCFINLLLLISINATSQDLNETIDYINDVFKVSRSWVVSFSGAGRAPNYSENPAYGIDKISVDSHGKIQFQRYLIDAITEKVLRTGGTCYALFKKSRC